ncbi:MAG: 2-hydroxyacyl-CoA dehydratase [Deltaproteobacteria bacterium]|nr:2-hydroxyacyl-CoA dehydratase [Deltaproteobacteria bacterium]
MKAFETLQKYYKERWNYQLLAKDWKEKGQKIIGYTDINCPEELIIAAGCLPLLMVGDPDSDSDVDYKYMQYPVSLPIRYLYEAILTGRYNFIDLICITAGDEWQSSLHGYLNEEKRLNPSLEYKETYFLEHLRTTFKHHRDYNFGRLVAFKDYLEEFSQRKITNRALSEAIEVTNETRKLLKKLSDLRKTDPPHISGCEALPIIMASMLMPKTEYNRLLKEFLDKEVNNLPKKDASKTRIFVSGSSVDHPKLYELIESTHAVVVGEDTAFGDRYAELLIRDDMDPMEAICDRYTYKPPDPWMLGMDETLKYRVKSVVAASAQGEIFFHIKDDQHPAWDYPDQEKELEKLGIPVLPLEPQQYKISNPKLLKKHIEAYIKSISSGGKK